MIYTINKNKKLELQLNQLKEEVNKNKIKEKPSIDNESSIDSELHKDNEETVIQRGFKKQSVSDLNDIVIAPYKIKPINLRILLGADKEVIKGNDDKGNKDRIEEVTKQKVENERKLEYKNLTQGYNTYNLSPPSESIERRNSEVEVNIENLGQGKFSKVEIKKITTVYENTDQIIDYMTEIKQNLLYNKDEQRKRLNSESSYINSLKPNTPGSTQNSSKSKNKSINNYNNNIVINSSSSVKQKNYELTKNIKSIKFDKSDKYLDNNDNSIIKTNIFNYKNLDIDDFRFNKCNDSNKLHNINNFNLEIKRSGNSSNHRNIENTGQFNLKKNDLNISELYSFKQQSKFFDDKRLVRNFEDFSMIGKGGFGKVFKARHKLDSSWYAIKMIELMVSKGENLSKHKVVREVKTMTKLEDKNVVRYFTCWFESKYTLDIFKFDNDESILKQSPKKIKSKPIPLCKMDDFIVKNANLNLSDLGFKFESESETENSTKKNKDENLNLHGDFIKLHRTNSQTGN